MNSSHNADAAQRSLRVPIVDDSPEDASLIMQELAHSQFQVSWERVENEADYLQQMQTVPGLILADALCRTSVPRGRCKCSKAQA
jgi:response regulator RpfG family c-di-GMP phosphodiesterase